MTTAGKLFSPPPVKNERSPDFLPKWPDGKPIYPADPQTPAEIRAMAARAERLADMAEDKSLDGGDRIEARMDAAGLRSILARARSRT